MDLIEELYLFLRHPSSLKKEDPVTGRIFKQFILYDFVITVAWALLIGLFLFLSKDFVQVFNSKQTHNSKDILLLGILMTPLIEELAYRFSLKVEPLTVSLSIAVQLVIYLHLLKLIELVLYQRLILMVIIAFFIHLILSKKMCYVIEDNYRSYFYYNLLAFALLHALNFSYFEFWHYLFIPILTSLQFFLGLFMAYVRLKYSFFWALGIHAIHNCIILGLGCIIN